jgi:hypothetical protein
LKNAIELVFPMNRKPRKRQDSIIIVAMTALIDKIENIL